ncbi:MAG: hypothetical protein E7066_09290 [Lentimicrobiaceae bacterium]|nr:hypothetical protein [Lentimicrobiaceae bacterium]
MSEKIDLIKGTIQNSSSSSPNDIDAYNIGSFIGEALDNDEKINSLISMTKPEITVLVGFVGFGKTSFIASCYHMLLTDGNIGDYMFYDSDTLTGFERRVYLRRISQEYDEITPQTRRTIRGEPHLLTLRFSHPKHGDKVVVISDHSGEDYDDYRNKKANLEKDVLLRNADRILFFVDCGKLVNNGRLNMQNQYSQLIQNMHETSSFRDSVKIQFLFNKLDLTEGKEEKYKLEKQRFLDTMNDILHIPIGDSVEVISNQVESETVKKLLLDIIDNTRMNIQGENDFSKLDWVKSMLK